MPQYRYAHDEDGHLADAMTLPSDRTQLSGTYTCINCGRELIAKTKGEKRIKHFAHKITRITCSQETYLHILAKETFREEYELCLDNNEPYAIELTYAKVCDRFSDMFHQSCPVGTLTKEHDLTQYFDRVKLEEREGQFVPDLLLYNSRNHMQRVFVEIVVTHFMSEEKRHSGERIIEIPIEVEEDVKKIRARRLTEDDASFVNFGKETNTVTESECRCVLLPHYCLVIYEGGRSSLGLAPLIELTRKYREKSEHIEYFQLQPIEQTVFPYDRGFVYKSMIEFAYHQGYAARSCFICRYEGSNWLPDPNAPIYCKRKRIRCGSNRAVGCNEFRIKKLESHHKPDEVPERSHHSGSSLVFSSTSGV